MKCIAIVMSLFILTGMPAYAQDWAKGRLDKSPRHLDWITVKNGDRQIKCFIAYPEVKNKATSVLVIHEIFGLSDWVRGICDQLAKEGYIAIAPDLLSGQPGEDSSKYEGTDALRKAVTQLPAEQVTEDLRAVSNYVCQLPAASGRLAVAGFCWGGTQTFRYATNNPEIESAFVFYGTAPDSLADLARIKANVYGFYGENDERVTSTVDKTFTLMKEAGKQYEPKIYAGAGHGFMRSGDAPDAEAANKGACTEAWARWTGLLQKI
jgi:carboxymethylenebutenolidase